MPNFEAKGTAKDRTTPPAKWREDLGVEPGDAALFSEHGYRTETRQQTLGDLKGVIKTGPSFTSADFARWLQEAGVRG